MNRKIPSALLIALFCLSDAAFALCEREDQQNNPACIAFDDFEEENEEKNQEQDEKDFIRQNTKARNDEITALKHALPFIEGNVLLNDHGCIDNKCKELGPAVLSATIDSSLTGKYGFLTFNSFGQFTYTLDRENPAVDALEVNDTLFEVFEYTIVEPWFRFIDHATLTIFIVGDEEPVTVIIALDDQNSVSKNSRLVAEGNVVLNDTGAKTALLLSAAASQYGFLEFDSSGDYKYTLNNTLPAVQALGPGQSINDIFRYTIEDDLGNTASALLTIHILGNPILSEEEKEDEKIRNSIVARNDVNTVTKNEKLTASGNVTTNDSGVLSVFLSSAPTTDFGSLTFDSSGAYTYKLNNNSKALDSLGLGETAEDVFSYTIEGEKGYTSTAKLIIHINGNPGASTDNVEIEINDRSRFSTPLHSGQLMRGSLQTSGDKDWFSLASLGNEIIHLELCPQGSSCFNEKAWVLYVFDSQKLTQEIEEETVPLRAFRNDTLKTLSTWDSNHMYLAMSAGVFESSLIGVINPCFGDSNAIDLGVGPDPRTYFIAISTPLLGDGNSKPGTEEIKEGDNPGCGAGSVILEREGPSFEETIVIEGEPDEEGNPTFTTETKTVNTTQQYIVAFPYSDDQYSISATGTGISPLTVKSVDAAVYDPEVKSLDIPSIRVMDNLYSAELLLQETGERSALDDAQKMVLMAIEQLDAELAGDPYQATYNPATNQVHLPQVIDKSTGEIYSVFLLYHGPSEDNEGWLEIIDMKIAE